MYATSYRAHTMQLHVIASNLNQRKNNNLFASNHDRYGNAELVKKRMFSIE